MRSLAPFALLVSLCAFASVAPSAAQEAEVHEYEVRYESKESLTETVDGEVEVVTSEEVDRARYLDRVESKDASGKVLTRVQFLIEAEHREATRITLDGKPDGEPEEAKETKSALGGRHLRWSGIGGPELEVVVLGEPKVGLSWDFYPSTVVLDGQTWLAAKAQAEQKLAAKDFLALKPSEAFAGLPAEVREEFLGEIVATRMAHGEGSLVSIVWSVARSSDPEQSVSFRLQVEARKPGSGEVARSEVELRLTQRKPSRAFPPLPQ